ncbi:MAG: DNA polymerase IV [Candidatus Dormibacteraeota bacterium]|nr:DNA polymerase IV [Candidatus Dormibacteraeota bacterium]
MPYPRTILHVDLDAFFASCELRRRPELAGRPLAVGGGVESHPGERRRPGRGVVAAASYEARPRGVRSAVSLSEAFRRCPELIVLPVDIGHYAAVSKEVFGIFSDYTPLVEPGSLDEAFLDVSGCELLHGSGPDIAREIQGRIASELSLPASVGVATSKTVAKIASDLRKPRGLVVVHPGDEERFLAPLPVARLPGAGPKTTERLRLLGIHTLGALAAAPTSLLVEVLGPGGEGLRARARGVDPAPVVVPTAPKSISRETTFDEDVADEAILEERLRLLAAGVGSRLRTNGLTAATVAIKVRFADFETVARRGPLGQPTCADVEIFRAARPLLRATVPAGRPVRLLGVGVEQLARLDSQMGLFDQVERRSERVDRAMDELRRRFGGSAIARGTAALEDSPDWNSDHLGQLRPS